MSTYLTPGVYIEEVSTGARPIEAVGTSTAAFIGVGPNAQEHVNEAVAINNKSEFMKEFAEGASSSTPLMQAVMGFFDNGGGRCYVVNIGRNGSVGGGAGGRKGVDVLETVDEVAIVAAPGYSDPISYDALLSHCEKMKDRVAILDPPKEVDEIDRLTEVATAGATESSSSEGESEGEEGEEEKKKKKKSSSGKGGLRPRISDEGYGALYFPWITVKDPMDPTRLINVPPSGHMAGIYARTDADRGVHKAPANEPIAGALDVTYRLTHEENGLLNSNGINCIRFFPREGIRVWGARTLAPSANEWRYLNVRRLFNMIEESIAQATRWVVFEPNDETLWKAVTRDCKAFLTNIWRDGALMGATPEQAFFVKCDAETNPPEVVDAGRMVVVIGIAPVKPAEFIIFQIGQQASGAEIS
mgnify:CR=1 FL=1